MDCTFTIDDAWQSGIRIDDARGAAPCSCMARPPWQTASGRQLVNVQCSTCIMLCLQLKWTPSHRCKAFSTHLNHQTCKAQHNSLFPARFQSKTRAPFLSLQELNPSHGSPSNVPLLASEPPGPLGPCFKNPIQLD